MKTENQTATTSMGYRQFLDWVPPTPWKLLPHTLAAHTSRGAWIPYDYLVILSHIITNEIAKGDGRILVSVPPRHGKSMFISQWLPVWFLTNWPQKNVILATYEAKFAAKWGRTDRNIFQEHPELGVVIAEDATASARWLTTEGGGMITAGVGGPLTGEGAHLLIGDDLHKNWAEVMSYTIRKGVHDWLDSTFLTRMEPGATAILLMTRWHEDDAIGYVMREKKDDGWIYIRLPAIAEADDFIGRSIGEALCPQRRDEKALERIRANTPRKVWNALFQQRPSSEEGNLFLRKYWQYYSTVPRCYYIVQSWDTASKRGDTSAQSNCQTWGLFDQGFALLDRFQDRMEFPQLRKAAGDQYNLWRPDVVLIEDKDSGQALASCLEQETSIPVIRVNPGNESKETRALYISPTVESHRCWLPGNVPWVQDYVDMMANFPNTEFKDDADSTSQAISFLMTLVTARSGGIVTAGGRKSMKLLEGFTSLPAR